MTMQTDPRILADYSDADSVEERKQRADERADELEHYVVSDDPFVVEVHSDHSDRTHVVIPSLLYCSCEDARYRGLVCYHQFHVADDVDDAKQPMQRALRDRQTELGADVTELQEQIRQIEGKIDTIQSTRACLGPTDDVETESESTDEDELPDFEQLVADVQANTGDFE